VGNDATGIVVNELETVVIDPRQRVGMVGAAASIVAR
jgi:hypothetical protein